MKNTKVLGLVFGILALGTLGVVSSQAVFNFTTSNPSSTFTAGQLHHINSRGGTTIFTTSPLMIPGDTITGTVTVTNDGNIPGFFKVNLTNLVDTPGTNGGNLSAVATVTIREGAAVLYTGLLGSMPETVLDGDTVTAGTQAFPVSGGNSAHTYTVTVLFPDGGVPPSNTTGDNAYSGSQTSFTLNWVQSDR